MDELKHDDISAKMQCRAASRTGGGPCFLLPLWLSTTFALLSSPGCASTPAWPEHVDSSHVLPAECVDGELRCLVNMLQECTFGRFQTTRACAGACLPASGCQPLPESVYSYIWVANSAEGTLSKINTQTVREEARYYTCEYASRQCDPSRTSVSLHGDVVVANRGLEQLPERIPASSVVKFATSRSDCLDRNGNGVIDTSTGPTDVRPWGEDECMLWSTDLPNHEELGDKVHGARTAAWDGTEDELTGRGGRVWVGTCDSLLEQDVHVFRLDGESGAILDEVRIPDTSCAYGGAVDARGSLWFLGTVTWTLTRIDAETLAWETRPTSCLYGITVDSKGRVWTGGLPPGGESSCVARYNPETDSEDIVEIPWISPSEPEPWLRGIAVGVGLSAGSVWAAETEGVLYRIDEETLEVTGSTRLGDYRLNMIGVAINHVGYVWTVARIAGMAYKVDPSSLEHLSIAVGSYPYTYSDMTGTQLRAVVGVR